MCRLQQGCGLLIAGHLRGLPRVEEGEQGPNCGCRQVVQQHLATCTLPHGAGEHAGKHGAPSSEDRLVGLNALAPSTDNHVTELAGGQERSQGPAKLLLVLGLAATGRRLAEALDDRKLARNAQGTVMQPSLRGVKDPRELHIRHTPGVAKRWGPAVADARGHAIVVVRYHEPVLARTAVQDLHLQLDGGVTPVAVEALHVDAYAFLQLPSAPLTDHPDDADAEPVPLGLQQRT
mmetsp:Transcript_59781/g.192405  ORF Transcript_59781/g.192405 Transcript_59781/m.192405 type:complete len:234 (-) Transcript_59781:202-903(-)